MAAVIHMMPYNSQITSLKSDIPSEFYKLWDISPMQPFSDEIITYLDTLSKEIRKDPRIRQFPDVATFAFFCRKSNINHLRNKHYNEDQLRLGRGLVFHVAPSNVPVNFSYSLVCGLLSGNANIVKVPSKSLEQIDIISRAIFRVAENQQESFVSDRVLLVRYDRGDENVTEKLSSICDIRVIWGGDDTINNIRRHSMPPRSFDITFADRYSFCIINADELVKERKIDLLARGFYNDTYLFDQNACTSPQLIVWTGDKDNIVASKEMFWEALYKIVEVKYDVQPVSTIDKLTALYSYSISGGKFNLEGKQDNLLLRVKLERLEKDIDNYSCNSGYFYEYDADSLGEVASIINRRYQTMAYYGFSKNELSNLIQSIKPSGIDRVTPIGQTMDFSLNWDGYNLINSLSRIVEIVRV